MDRLPRGEQLFGKFDCLVGIGGMSIGTNFSPKVERHFEGVTPDENDHVVACTIGSHFSD
jgi:hypothetical protein